MGKINPRHMIILAVIAFLMATTLGVAVAAHGTIIPLFMDVGSDIAVDEDCLTFEETGDIFEWQTCGGGGSFYQTVEDEGTGQAQQAILNFTGAGVTCADDTTRTTCDITAGGATSGYVPINEFVGTYSDVTTYAVREGVRALDGSDWKLYISLVDSNLGNDPVTDGGVNWLDTVADGKAVFIQGVANPNTAGEQNSIAHFTHNATGGTWDIFVNLGNATGLAWDATEAAIQSALDASTGAGRVIIIGDAADFTIECYCTFSAVSGVNLTGGGFTLEEEIQARIQGGFESSIASTYIEQTADETIGLWWYNGDNEQWTHEQIIELDSAANQSLDAGLKAIRTGQGFGNVIITTTATRGGIGDGDIENTFRSTRAGLGSGNSAITFESVLSEPAVGEASALFSASHHGNGNFRAASVQILANVTEAHTQINGDVLFRDQGAGSRNPYQDTDEEITDTTLAPSANLAVSLDAGRRYKFKYILFTLNDGATEGVKLAVNGTVGVTNLKTQITIYDDTLNTMVALARVTSLGSSVGAGVSAGAGYAVIEGTVEVNTGGTFGLEFAQNATGASSGVHIEVGSNLEIISLE